MYKITITNPGSHYANPLLKLADCEYDSRGEACEAIYAALYDVITSEAGSEVATREAEGGGTLSDDDYISVCHDAIYESGCASEDGVTATVEEC